MSNKSLEEILKLLSLGKELSDKQMKDYKFWNTQPVPKLNEEIKEEGLIDVQKQPTDVSDTPLPLLSSFEWSNIDIDNSSSLDEVYNLLYENYVEDNDATFRFNYSHEFFKWALKAPGYHKDWHLGVRVKETGKLVAFIAAIPITLKLNKSDKIIPSVEINFLCIHKKLRSKRLAPVLIKEITRRVNKFDIWQALYTAGVVLPSPISVCRYTHRPINWKKLNDVGFSHLPQNKTINDMVKYYQLSETTNINGLRPMETKDLDQVFTLLESFQKRFDLIQVFTKDELAHWLQGNDAVVEGNDGSTVIKTYVVEKDGNITDFFSYYLLPFTVLENDKHNQLNIAYLFYYASDEKNEYKSRINELINDALITSKEFNVDVFNCLTSQDNSYFIKDLKFGQGDGFLNYYLFNYKAWPVSGGIDPQTKDVVEDTTSGVGVVLL